MARASMPGCSRASEEDLTIGRGPNHKTTSWKALRRPHHKMINTIHVMPRTKIDCSKGMISRSPRLSDTDDSTRIITQAIIHQRAFHRLAGLGTGLGSWSCVGRRFRAHRSRNTINKTNPMRKTNSHRLVGESHTDSSGGFLYAGELIYAKLLIRHDSTATAMAIKPANDPAAQGFSTVLECAASVTEETGANSSTCPFPKAARKSMY